MKIRVAKDPKTAVGGMWDEIGRFQFDFLCAQGLMPYHTLLDIGCGTLRGGLHFIEYLEEGKYYGIDISAEALGAGEIFLIEAKLQHKQPTLKVNTDLKFKNLHGRAFDFLLAQSVLTHMPIEDIGELFANIHKVMHYRSVFFATFSERNTIRYKKQRLAFRYPFEILRTIGENNGCSVVLVENFAHPRNQKMMKITKNSPAKP